MPFTRRQFLKTAALTAAPFILPSNALGQVAPSERLTVAVIGLGGRGMGMLGRFIQQPDVQVVAVCDVHDVHYRDRAWGVGSKCGRVAGQEVATRYYERNAKGGAKPTVDAYTDFREVCVRDDIDVIGIATPDHWHYHCLMEALARGKDIYCEKPITHTFAEGLRVCEEVAARKAIVQVGSQQRSDRLFRRAVELVQNGHLGDVERVEVGLPAGYPEPMGDTAIETPPEGLDYDFWTGPAEVLPYMRARHHRWWRGHSNYGGGNIMDWIGHHNDIAHWALGLDASGPRTVEAANFEYIDSTVYNTPHEYDIHCAYPNGVTSTLSSRLKPGTKWIGPDGWVHVDRGRLTASDERWVEDAFDPGPKKAYVSDEHTRNFLDCVKTREACIAPPETNHRSITPGYLAYLSHAFGNPIEWDETGQHVVGNDVADAMLRQNPYRAPWDV